MDVLAVYYFRHSYPSVLTLYLDLLLSKVLHRLPPNFHILLSRFAWNLLRVSISVSGYYSAFIKFINNVTFGKRFIPFFCWKQLLRIHILKVLNDSNLFLKKVFCLQKRLKAQNIKLVEYICCVGWEFNYITADIFSWANFIVRPFSVLKFVHSYFVTSNLKCGMHSLFISCKILNSFVKHLIVDASSSPPVSLKSNSCNKI